LAETDGLLVDNIFLHKAFFLETDVGKPLVNQGLWWWKKKSLHLVTNHPN